MYIENVKIDAFMEYAIQNADKRKKPTKHRDLVASVELQCGIDSDHLAAIVESIQSAFSFDPVTVETSFKTGNF